MILQPTQSELQYVFAGLSNTHERVQKERVVTFLNKRNNILYIKDQNEAGFSGGRSYFYP